MMPPADLRALRIAVGLTALGLLAITVPTRAALATEQVVAEQLPTGEAAVALPAAPADAWPMARGTVAGTGRSAATLRVPLTEAWQREFTGTAFGATPVIAGGTIFLGDLDGTFHALDLETGETRWTFTAESAGFPSAAALSTDPALPLVVVGDDAGVVRALDRATGDVRWTHETGGEISGGPTILATTSGPRVLVGSQDASLSCLALADGSVVWSHSITDQIRCSPTVAHMAAGDVVFIAGCDGKLHIIDADTGTERATVPIDGPTGTTPAAEDGRVYFGTEGGTFFAIDAAEAREVWRAASVPAGQSYRSSAALADGLVIVGSRGRAIEAFAAADGARRWRHPMRGRVDAAPLVVLAQGADAAAARPAAIVADAAGTIAVLDTATGERRWQFDAGAGFTGGPAVAQGRLVIASDRGTVWCFTTAPPEP